MNTSLVTIIGAIVIVAIAVLFVVLYSKFGRNKKYTEAANKFLTGLENKFISIICDIIDSYNFSSGKSLEEIEKDILDKIYNEIADYITDQLKKSDNKLIALAAHVITKEFIIEWIDKLVEKFGIKDTISTRYAAQNIKMNSEAFVEADKKLQEEFEKEDYIDDIEGVNLNNLEEDKQEPSEEEIKDINPPTDEVVYSDDDSSVEIVKEEIILRHDKNGNPLYYKMDENGALKRVTKKFVQESGLPIKEE